MKKMINILIGFLMIISLNAYSVVGCDITKENGGGFTTTIQSVIDNCDSYTIIMRIEHNGCSGPSCKDLSHYSVEVQPGTYSDITVTVLEGNMTWNLDLGPNLGQDGIQGFKLDNTKNIGGGDAGIFTIQYNLTELQDQIFIAKAGNNLQSVEFTVNEFETVRDCNGNICSNDEIENYFPANGYGTLAFEDLWPSKGDYDFNDMVIDYQFKINTDDNNFIQSVDGTFIIKAFGASFENGFGFVLDESINQNDIIVTGYELTENFIDLNSNGLENSQSKPTIIVFDNAFNQMQHPGMGIGVNTEKSALYVTPDTIRLNIMFNNNYTIEQLNISEFNPFIFVNKERSVEIHLPNYEPTDLANLELIGTYDDNENYKTVNNLPWAIHIYNEFNYPIEKQEITGSHLKFFEWAETEGELYPDWYLDKHGYRNANLIY
jgi:LruC domain-containing protein